MPFPSEIINEILQYWDFREYTLSEVYQFFEHTIKQCALFDAWNARNSIIGLNKDKINEMLIVENNLSLDKFYPRVYEACKDIRPAIVQKLIIHKTIECVVKNQLIYDLSRDGNYLFKEDLPSLLETMIQDRACLSGSTIFKAMYRNTPSNDIDIFVSCDATKLIEWFDSRKDQYRQIDSKIDDSLFKFYNPSDAIPIQKVVSYLSDKVGIIQLIFVPGDPREHITKWFDLNIVRNYYDGKNLVISDLPALLSKRIEITHIAPSWNTPVKMFIRLFKYTRYSGFKVYVSDLNVIPRNPGWPRDVEQGKVCVPSQNDIELLNHHILPVRKSKIIDPALEPKVVDCNGNPIDISYTTDYLQQKFGDIEFTIFNYSRISFIYDPKLKSN